jgi:hypothetical protein
VVEIEEKTIQLPFTTGYLAQCRGRYKIIVVCVCGWVDGIVVPACLVAWLKLFFSLAAVTSRRLIAYRCPSGPIDIDKGHLFSGFSGQDLWGTGTRRLVIDFNGACI